MATQSVLISNVHRILKDYRKGEWGIKAITKSKVKDWANQFDVKHRNLVLAELNHILKKRYYSKRRIKSVLRREITGMSRDLGFKSTKAFLKHVTFVNVQSAGKSQNDLLRLLNEVLVKRFSMELQQCGQLSHRYTIYIDDMLCTGQTLQRDIIKWGNQVFSNSRITNKRALELGRTKLILVYIFCHMKEYKKKLYQIGKYYFQNGSFDPDLYCQVSIDNTEGKSKNQMMIPSKSVLSKKMLQYRDQVNNEVDEHLFGREFKVLGSRFFRQINYPRRESFFSSSESRNTVEKVFLVKGIDIARNAVNRKINIRPLGYALPSTRNFGFGALCFTYRNISNNTPLVFWYSFTNFQPLFEKREF